MGSKASKNRKENVENLKKDVYVNYQVDKPHITIKSKQYAIVEKIGQGGFGVVYKATYNGALFAIKKMQLDSTNSESILKELQFIAQVGRGMDPKVLPIIRIYEIDMANSFIYMVMELALCDLNDLVEQVKTKRGIDKDFVDFVFAFLLKALVFLYENDTIHGDIKFQNFVVLEDKSHPLEYNIKLIDFGTINKLDRDVSKIQNGSIAGTLAYLAPEQASGTVHKKTDIWALGVMLYCMVFSSYPAYVQDEKSIAAFLIMSNDLHVPNPSPEFATYRKIIQMCLVKDLNKRASAKDLLAVLPAVVNENLIEQVIGKNVKVYESQEVATYMLQKRNQQANKQVAREAISGQCRVCSASLPPSHTYNRCDNCFKNKSKKCIVCGKVQENFQFSRCNACFQKTKKFDNNNHF